MFKRIFLFALTNILVVATISIVLSVLGVRPYLTRAGIDYQSLAVFCLVWGMGGALISLAMSKVMAKWMMGVQLISPDTRDPQAMELLQIVHKLAMGAGLPKVPEVGVYDSPEVNAFATGPSKGNALVAVSTGLLQRMQRSEIEGVLGHEISHVANGDMVTMTLIQGVVNAFVMFLARVVAFAVANVLRGDDEERSPSYFVQQMLVLVLDIVFGLLGSMVVCWFSRQREFRADQGSAALAGREKMISALVALERATGVADASPAGFASLKISAPAPKGFWALLMTHPPLPERIDRLRRTA